MAFNPFHKFRKHQKALFAVLTIICMFIFVGSAGMGAGDLIASLMGMIGVRGSQGAGMASLYGADVSQRDLVFLARQREIANTYMSSATDFALQNRMQELRPPGDQRMTGDLLQKMFRDPEVIQMQQRLNMQPYFGGAFNTQGLLDFKIWLHEADRLGISKLSMADIQKEVNRLTNNRLSKLQSGQIEQMLRGKFREGFSADVLVQALGNEFRAQMAQSAILGIEPSSLARMPTPITPDEFWEFFKENTTKLDIQLVAVKAEDFLAQVKDPPNDKELRELYQKYKDREFSPEAKEPGFKLPRRIAVEWVSGKFDSPYYKKAAADFRVLVQATQQVGFGATNRAVLSGIAPALEQSITAGIDPLVTAEYERTKWPHYLAASYTRPWFLTRPFAIHDKNMLQPANIVAALAAPAGDMTPLSMLGTYLGTATYRETQARAERGSTWLLAGAQPTSLTASLAATAVAWDLTPAAEYMPISQFQDMLSQRILTFLAQDLLANNLKAVTKEVESRSKEAEKDKEKAQKLAEDIAKLVKQYDLQTGKTGEPRDLFKNKLADDPGLKPLKDAYVRPPSFDREGKRFTDLFLGREVKPPYVVERFPQNFGRPQEDDSEWKSAPESFIYWKTEDRAAKTAPFDDPEVKKDVERAWRMQKARALAKSEAERLEVKAREEKGDPRKLKDFAEKQKKELIELPAIAKRMQVPSFRAEVAYMYEPPRIPDDKVPHAGPDFANKLLDLQKKGKGDTLVVPDFPENVYYVAILTNKKEPTLDEFFTVYREGSSDAIRRNPLLQMFEQEKQVGYFKDVLEELRKQAKLVINDKGKEKDSNLTTED
ncbi:hypothetical protein AYO44_08995 [Planctomycetaceae bacterium SCGC AG-212-F19]|nr:hypothetical protein AYO44_08995 [Planctomycetaceae bacterium SCGC AG-212-F19]